MGYFPVIVTTYELDEHILVIPNQLKNGKYFSNSLCMNIYMIPDYYRKHNSLALNKFFRMDRNGLLGGQYVGGISTPPALKNSLEKCRKLEKIIHERIQSFDQVPYKYDKTFQVEEGNRIMYDSYVSNLENNPWGISICTPLMIRLLKDVKKS